MAEYRVLIVDDQRDARRRLRAQLESLGLGLNVSEVSSGEEALLVLSRQAFHLLVTNLRLAGISGLELLPKARRCQPELKAILVLSAADKKLEDKIPAGDWVSWLYKPLHADQLKQVVMHSLDLDPRAAHPVELGQVDEQPQANLAERLGDLRRALNALSVSLLDDNGRLIAQAGDGVHADKLAALIPDLMATYSAAGRVSLALKTGIPESVLFFIGTEYDLALAHVGQLVVLLVISSSNLRGEMETNLIRLLRPAVTDMLQILSEMGLLVAPMPAPLVEQPVSQVEDQADADLGDLEEILQGAEEGRFEAVDLDRFWDDLAQEHSGKKAPGTGELSYEQAHQIGLTPEE